MRNPAHAIREALAPLVDLIYPPRCPSCGDGIGEQSGLCTKCWTTLAVPGEPACTTCQRPLPVATGDGAMQCGACLSQTPLHDGIAAATLYNDTSRKLVLSFKHGRKIALAEMLARLMAARIPDGQNERLIVPVPLHRWRIWRRGYNQAALLGRELEKAGKGRLVVDALVRRKPTPPLGGLGTKARARELLGAIAIRAGADTEIAGHDIILVDDVLTSGATSNACVKALKKAGGKSVLVACFARVLNDPHGWGEPVNETPETKTVPGAT